MLRNESALDHIDSTPVSTHRPIGILKAVYGDNGIYQCRRMSPERRTACERRRQKSKSREFAAEPPRPSQASKRELHAHEHPKLQPRETKPFIIPLTHPQFLRHTPPDTSTSPKSASRRPMQNTT